MEGTSWRRQPALSLQREFAGSRLEEQILRRAFALVIPALPQESIDVEPCNNEAERPPVHTTCCQGA